MNSLYLTAEDISEAFRKVDLEEHYNFLHDDLVKLANAFVMAAMPAIVRTERAMCVQFVASLNPEVAKALEDKRNAL